MLMKLLKEIADYSEAKALYDTECLFWTAHSCKRSNTAKLQAAGALAFLQYFHDYIIVEAYWFSWSPAGAQEAAKRLKISISRVARTNNTLESFNGCIKNRYWLQFQHSGRLPCLDLYTNLTITRVIPEFFEKLEQDQQLKNYYENLWTILPKHFNAHTLSADLPVHHSTPDSSFEEAKEMPPISNHSSMTAIEVFDFTQQWIDGLDEEKDELPPDELNIDSNAVDVAVPPKALCNEGAKHSENKSNTKRSSEDNIVESSILGEQAIIPRPCKPYEKHLREEDFMIVDDSEDYEARMDSDDIPSPVPESPESSEFSDFFPSTSVPQSPILHKDDSSEDCDRINEVTTTMMEPNLGFWHITNPTQDIPTWSMIDQSHFAEDGARVNVGVKELLKRAISQASRSTRDNSGVDDESDDSDDAGRKKKSKQKKLDFPPEEKEQLKIIQDLTDRYRCNDKQCSNTTCYLAGPTGEHINLTHLHLRTWAAAVQGNKEGADMDTPPNNKLFDASCSRNVMDISTLAKRRAGIVKNDQNTSALAPLAGLAELIHAIRGPPSVADAALPVAPASNLLEPMDLDDFCMLFGISYGLKLKLEDADITGPHVLRLVSDTDLRSDAKLSIGELATLQDAEERWKVRQTAL
ncbi:hypothetical protein EST38_g11336 [Candolleomyces aberdarensis]|uniref:Uncharacterized protein n=1 Tax=Candolleomyces aberdarensis TaxID=2316362 RepID=A0A4Q2D529_9AGAR|nr:hypothetical protein EST38_g11336 [Candolleomyces aberdarensis]